MALIDPGPVRLAPECFTGLTALMSLKLQECGLINIPPALAALGGSLTSLELPLNNGLQLADDDFTALLALQKLRKLNLHKSSLSESYDSGDRALASAAQAHLQFVPALWSSCSLKHLVRLPGAFLKGHGHELDLEM